MMTVRRQRDRTTVGVQDKNAQCEVEAGHKHDKVGQNM